MASHNIEKLPATFTFSEAMAAGLTKHRLYALRDAGRLEVISRGLFRRADDASPLDLDLIEIVHRAPKATLCLTTALAHHDLTDANPPAIDIAIPAGGHRPLVTAPVAWHMFDRSTFDIGREPLIIDGGATIGIYTPPRSIIDAFRLAYREGDELGYIALRRWIRRRGSSPAALIAMSRSFPKTTTSITRALEIIQHE